MGKKTAQSNGWTAGRNRLLLGRATAIAEHTGLLRQCGLTTKCEFDIRGNYRARYGQPVCYWISLTNTADVREVDEDTLRPILFLLQSPDIEVQRAASAALGNLAVNGTLRSGAGTRLD